jgi:hypothetical protein
MKTQIVVFKVGVPMILQQEAFFLAIDERCIGAAHCFSAWIAGGSEAWCLDGIFLRCNTNVNVWVENFVKCQKTNTVVFFKLFDDTQKNWNRLPKIQKLQKNI